MPTTKGKGKGKKRGSAEKKGKAGKKPVHTDSEGEDDLRTPAAKKKKMAAQAKRKISVDEEKDDALQGK